MIQIITKDPFKEKSFKGLPFNGIMESSLESLPVIPVVNMINKEGTEMQCIRARIRRNR
jgi:hypothetical protein